MVGAPRFELGTSWSRTKRATRLRYAPKNCQTPIFKIFQTTMRLEVIRHLISNCIKVKVHVKDTNPRGVPHLPQVFSEYLSFEGSRSMPPRLQQTASEIHRWSVAGTTRQIAVLQSSAEWDNGPTAADSYRAAVPSRNPRSFSKSTIPRIFFCGNNQKAGRPKRGGKICRVVAPRLGSGCLATPAMHRSLGRTSKLNSYLSDI